MTEMDWLTSNDPKLMLTWITTQPGDRPSRGNNMHYVASDRKVRLFACACCRANGVDSERVDRLEACLTSELPFQFPVGPPEAWVLHWAQTGTWNVPDQVKVALLREIVGNPWRPVNGRILPCDGTAAMNVKAIAQAIYQDRTFDRLPILADALEDAGCGNAAILDHCIDIGPHVRGCWVLDLILGKE